MKKTSGKKTKLLSRAKGVSLRRFLRGESPELIFEQSTNDWLPGYQQRSFSYLLKQAFDFVFAVIALVLLSPLLLLIAILIKLEDSGPVIFKQTRAGQGNRPFTMYKFRTMCVEAEKISLEIIKDDPRITRCGKILRNSSLDELPQFFNILRGEMSLIGPRPLLPGTVRRDEFRRQEMKPGLTSLPVLYGRKALDWETRMPIDLFYVDHWSLKLDLIILLKTPLIVISQENVYDENGGSSFRNPPPAQPNASNQQSNTNTA